MASGHKQRRLWYRNTNVGMEVGPTGTQFGVECGDNVFASRFSGRDIVEGCVQANAEYLVIWAKDGEFAYYDSKIVPKAPGLGKQDVLAESIEAGKSHELPIIAYCELQHPVYLLWKHTEYRMLDIKGNEISGRVCFNSGYLHHVKQIATAR